MRWVAELALFNFTIHYRSGKHNGIADALSRKRMLEPELTRFESSMETVTAALGMALESIIIPEQLKSTIWETMTGVHMEQIQVGSTPTAMLTFPGIAKEDMANNCCTHWSYLVFLGHRKDAHHTTAHQRKTSRPVSCYVNGRDCQTSVVCFIG